MQFRSERNNVKGFGQRKEPAKLKLVQLRPQSKYLYNFRLKLHNME